MRIFNQLTTIVVTPIIGIVILASVLMYQTQTGLRQIDKALRIDDALVSVADLVGKLQLERGAGAGHLSSQGEAFARSFEAKTLATNIAVQRLLLRELRKTHGISERCDEIQVSLASLHSRRSAVLTRATTVDDHIKFYSDLNEKLLSVVHPLLGDSPSNHFTRDTITRYHLLAAQESAGRERAALASVFESGELSLDRYGSWVQLVTLQDSHLRSAGELTPDPVLRQDLARFCQSNWAQMVREFRQDMHRMVKDDNVTPDSKKCFAAASARITSLVNLRNSFESRSRESVTALGNHYKKSIAASVAGLLACIAITVLVLRHIARQSFVQPIRSLADAADCLADGNFDISFSNSPGGEIGEVMNNVSKISASLRSVHSEVTKHVEAADYGDLAKRADADKHHGAYAELVTSVNRLSASLTTIDVEILKIITAVADGDVSSRLEGDYRGDFKSMQVSFNAALNKITEILSEVQRTNQQASAASDKVQDQSQSIARNTSEQASALVEVATSLEQMTAMTRQSATSATSAIDVAESTRDASQQGALQVAELVTAINRIKKVGDEQTMILKTIDEIAFQTNLLALNAAVEAARAGEAGKGFAVVADEVRNLALRSAEAASTTARMTEQALEETGTGVELANEVSTLLNEICTWADRSTECVGEIASGCCEQALGIEQISSAVSQLDSAVQDSSQQCQQTSMEAIKTRALITDLDELLATFRFVKSDYSRDMTSIHGDASSNSHSSEQVTDSDAPVYQGQLHPSVSGNIATAEEMIPFDTKDFSDF